MSNQYLRKVGLVVSTGTQGLDLSNMQIKFSVSQADAETPNTARIRVYNLKRTTAQEIQREFQKVTLQAGYEGGNQYGVIFEGTIKQVRRGREDALSSFVDIMAADADEAFQFAVVNKTLAAGSTPEQRAQAVAESMQKYGVTMGDKNGLVGGTLPRGKVLFGLAREQMGPITRTTNTTWSIQNGKLVVIPMTGYLPDEAVVLNSRSGLIGVPEATLNGVEATCLLNPKIKIGTRVQINQSEINQTVVRGVGYPSYRNPISFPADTADDGFYRVLVAEHEGDSRGQEWYTHITCLTVNQSSQPSNSVLNYG